MRNFSPLSPSHVNVIDRTEGWRSPIKPSSKEAIRTLALPPLESMLAACGDIHVVRLVCKKWRDARPRTHICIHKGFKPELLAAVKRLDWQLERIRVLNIDFSDAAHTGHLAKILYDSRRTLRSIHFVSCVVTEAEFDDLRAIWAPIITDLRFSSCQVRSARAPSALVGELSFLERLEWSGSTRQLAPRLAVPALGLRIDELPRQLRTLVCGGQTISRACVVALVENMKDLRTLRVARFASEDDVVRLSLLPHLHTLSIGGLASAHAYSALTQLPALKNLSLWWQGDNIAPMVEAALADMPQLQHLELNPGLFATHHVPRVANMPMLQSLSLRGLVFDAPTTHAHLLLDNVPRLEELLLTRCRVGSASLSQVCAMFESVTGLRRIVIQDTVPQARASLVADQLSKRLVNIAVTVVAQT